MSSAFLAVFIFVKRIVGASSVTVITAVRQHGAITGRKRLFVMSTVRSLIVVTITTLSSHFILSIQGIVAIFVLVLAIFSVSKQLLIYEL